MSEVKKNILPPFEIIKPEYQFTKTKKIHTFILNYGTHQELYMCHRGERKEEHALGESGQ
jgi:hypothetical protein